MTVRELLTYIESVKPHVFPDSALLLWLNELEGRVQLDIFLMAQEETVEYTLPDDNETVLLVDLPHTGIYRYWLEAMIDFESGEYSSYQNDMELFNNAWNEFACWFAETQGTEGDGVSRGFYISAYGIAVKHGYEGTEEEWLEALKGPQGPVGPEGPHGPQGADGNVDFESLTAAQVEMLRGPRGIQGEVGPAGPKGEQGEQGIQGETGPVGPKGEQGEKGDKGETGATGPQGATGATGPKGDKGEKGDTGAQGPQGIQGDVGPTGPQGPKGDTGPQGPQGEKGETGSGFAVLDYYDTKEQLEAAVLNPERGDAYGVGVAEPYDIHIYSPTKGWVNNGPLQGAKGDTGPRGPKGDTGGTGPQGPKGDTGATGPQGPKGDKGDKGDTGATGPAGADGKTPVKGTDYWTAADKSSMVIDVLAALPTWAGGIF